MLPRDPWRAMKDGRGNQRRHNDRPDPQCQPRLRARRPWRRRHVAPWSDGRGARRALPHRVASIADRRARHPRGGRQRARRGHGRRAHARRRPAVQCRARRQLYERGTLEMDAAVMDGRERRAGAVAGICGPRNPVLAARAVMEHTPHVLLAGEGAVAFCRARGLAFAEREYFYTESRWQALQHILERRQRGLPDTDPEEDDALRHGTVGAVARDRDGNLAAATSTGGIAGKLPGRIGDSPIIGAGTYADNASCAVSATGHGEIFMRFGAAFEIAARMRHRGQPLDAAAREVIEALAEAGGSGGLVAVDRDGSLALP